MNNTNTNTNTNQTNDSEKKRTMEEIDKMLEEGRLEDVIPAATKLKESITLDVTPEDDEMAYNASAMIAYANFNLKKFSESEKEYDWLASKTNESQAWFNVSLSAVMNNNTSKGFELFQKAYDMFLADKEITPARLFETRRYFMCALIDTGEYEKALEQLDILKPNYYGVSDQTYLMNKMGGRINPLSATLSYSKPIFEYMGKDRANAWFADIVPNLDAEAKSNVETLKTELGF